METGEFVIGGIVVACLGLVIAGAVMQVGEEKDWNKFAVEHYCRKVSEEKGNTRLVPIIGANGQVSWMPQVEPDKTGYVCDDGVTYIR